MHLKEKSFTFVFIFKLQVKKNFNYIFYVLFITPKMDGDTSGTLPISKIVPVFLKIILPQHA